MLTMFHAFHPYSLLAEADPASHVYNHVWWKSADGFWLWSGNQGNLLLTGLIMIFGFLWAAKHIRTGSEDEGHDAYITKHHVAHMFEVLCVYLRDEVARPLIGDRTDKYMPFLWTLFFFVLINNLLGLFPILDVLHLIFPAWKEAHRVPIGGTATQNLWVTGALAIISGIVFNVAAIQRLGLKGYFAHMTGGAPFFVAPLIFALEFLGQIVIKPGALAIRLFANMTAGHILLAVLLGFVGAVVNKSLTVSGPVTLISVLGATALMFLELLVAIIQAFIFMFLTALFISLMDHHDEHSHEHEHGHATSHEHAVA